jgi:DNA helicase II / ATP-dependent DNA helicase PcrA
MEYIKDLNDKQHMAVTAPLQNTLVLAGAGSGKTKVLVSRIAWLVEEANIELNSILAVTFTNKAAKEMKNRLQQLLSQSLDRLWIGTFHGLCHRMLRIHHQAANLPAQFQILDHDDQARIIKGVMQDLALDLEQWPVKQAQIFINRKKDEGLRAQHVNVPSYGPDRTLLRIYQGYENACQRAGVVDFAELLFRTHELLRDTPELQAHYHARFKAILVDEFQDTNTLQYAWIRLLANAGAKVMAVGDDDQSIYGWRGAKVENLQQFTHDFPHAQVIRLEQNYRSTSTILQAANSLIDRNQQRMGKNLWTESDLGEKIVVFSALNELEEARFVADKIQQQISQSHSLDDFAILYRSNAQSRVLEESLLRNGIAYHIHGGLRFFERMEIKDLLGYLRLIVNVDDDLAFERIINVPARGIGEKTLAAVREQAKNSQQSMWQAAKFLLNNAQFTQRAATALARFMQWIEQTQQSIAYCNLDEKVSIVLEQSGLYTYFANLKGENTQTKLENLRELVNAAKQFQDEYVDEEPILSAFLANTSLDAGDLTLDESVPSVSLMTLHASKGLEFPVVFMVGMEDGVFPGKPALSDDNQIEEERRLCYVGMTRAMQNLVMSYAEVRRQYGREERHRPSRFLHEISSEFLQEIRTKTNFYATPRAPTSVFSKNTYAGFSVGQQVRHPVFGLGVILAFEGSDAQARAQVRFSNNETKWLVIAYAKLTV